MFRTPWGSPPLASRAFASLAVFVTVIMLSGCGVPAPALQSERGRNIDACNKMAELYLQLYEDADSGNMGDSDVYVNGFLASWRRIGIEANSPMGVWMVENVEAAAAQRAAGDTAVTEAKGEALANGEAVEVDEGSLQDRCENLGVILP
jgi:hypothetical protein